MAKGRRKKKRGGPTGGDQSGMRAAIRPVPIAVRTELAQRPLAVARVLSAVLLLVGVVMLVLGGGVLTGRITEGWGFPMSAVPNWGRPWGAVLMLAGAAYTLFPIQLFLRPQKGTVAMMVVSGLSVLVGTPLITTTTEIFYNLLAQVDCQADWTKCRPDWVDSVWGYYMLLNVGNLIAVYRTLGSREGQAQTTPSTT